MRTAALIAVVPTAVLMAAPAVARADEVRAISLADALAAARAHNPRFLAATAERDRAAAELAATAGIDDRVIEAGADAATRRNDAVSGPVFQDTGADVVGGHVAAWQPLPWGGRVGVAVRDQVVRSSMRVAVAGPPSDIDTTVHQPSLELVWQQPLMRDRGRERRDRPRALAAAGVAAADAAHTGAELALALDVERAYWELAYADRELTIRDSALAVAREQLAVTRARAEVGKTNELEAATVEQAIAAREAARLAAEQDRAARALALAVLLGDDDGARLTAADPLDAGVAAPATADAVARARAFAPALHVLDAQARAASVAAAAASDDLAPRLDLLVRGGPMGNATEAGEAWAQLGRFDGYQASAALSFSLPVGNRAARGKRDAARASHQALVLARADRDRALAAEVARAIDAVALTERRIAAASQAAELARRTVALERDRWQAGAGTAFDVFQRQDQQVAAEAALARARADRRIAIASLRALTGP